VQTKMLLLFLLFAGLLSFSCGILDSDSPAPGQKIQVEFSDYAFIDTSSYILLKVDESYSNPPPIESYIWYEYIIGEPFTDINGNGVYDRGIDIFIRTTGEDNDDINHNGLYDGPCNICLDYCNLTEGVPFDDIDGNGELRYENPDYIFEETYEPGLPFCDLNGNGVWDTLLGHDLYYLVKCSVYVRSHDTLTHNFFCRDLAYIFESDSGITYCFNTNSCSGNEYTSYRYRNIPYYGLQFESHSNGFSYHHPNFYELRVLDPGKITIDTNLIDSVYYRDDWVLFRKDIYLDTLIIIDDTAYDGILLVHCSKFIKDGNSFHDGMYYSFYFSKELGLIAFIYSDPSLDIYQHYYFDTRYDTIPIPMTR